MKLTTSLSKHSIIWKIVQYRTHLLKSLIHRQLHTTKSFAMHVNIQGVENI